MSKVKDIAYSDTSKERLRKAGRVWRRMTIDITNLALGLGIAGVFLGFDISA